MPAKVEDVVSQFTKFLDDSLARVKKSKTIDELLKLPVYCFKFLTKEEAKIIEDLFEVFDIGEAAKLDKNDPFQKLLVFDQTNDPIKNTQMREELEYKIDELKQKFPTLEKNLIKVITVSSIIVTSVATPPDTSKFEQKVVVVGLDNAGKTAILSKFGNRLGINDLAKIKPTKGIQRQKLKADSMDLIVWDFGGQAAYRRKYLSNPDQYFIQINLLIYVIDVQDGSRIEESIEYFKDILKVVHLLEERPYMMIYIHKFDPDLKNNADILLNVEFIKEKLSEVFQSEGFDFDYEIYLTSIFSLISNEPKFSKFIKDVMSSSRSLSDPVLKKVDGLAKILEETMNAVIRLSESTTLQIREIDNRLRQIESGAVQVGQAQAQAPRAPGIPPGPGQIPAAPAVRTQENVRSNVLDELKFLFQKQKRLEL